MTKKYDSPMLQVVSISKKDVIATSLGINNAEGYGEFSAGRRYNVFDEWYEGY